MNYLKLLRPKDAQQLAINRETQKKVQGTTREIDFKPVVKLHIPFTCCMWLLTELDDEGMAFGLCQIHVAELGYVWLPELLDIDVKGIKVVQDLAFVPQMTLRQYADAARRNGGLLLP